MSSSIPGAAARRRRRAVANALALSVPVLAILAAVVIYGPNWFPSTPGIEQGEARWHSQELGRNRTAILAAIAGALAAIGAIYTALNFRLSRRGHITERFFKAVELVDPTKPASVRLGGIYALEAVAAESPADIQVVLNVLQAYLTSDSASDLDKAAASDVISRLEWTPSESSLRDRARARNTMMVLSLPAIGLMGLSIWLASEDVSLFIVAPVGLAYGLYGVAVGGRISEAMGTLYAPLPEHQPLADSQLADR